MPLTNKDEHGLDRASPAEFIEVVQKDQEVAGLSIDGEVLLTGDVIYNHPIKITGCRFKGDFTIKNARFLETFILVDTVFEEKFVIQSGSSFESDFIINRCEFVICQIDRGVSYNKGVTIEHTTANSFRMSGVIISNGLTIWGNKFLGFCSVEDVSSHSASIFSNYFTTWGSFRFGRMRGSITVSSNEKGSGELIISVDSCDWIRIEAEIHNSLTISRSRVNTIMWINATVPASASVKFSDVSVHRIALASIENRGELSFFNVRAVGFNDEVSRVVNGKKEARHRHDDEQHSLVSFNRVNFGRATFIDFDFESFENQNFISCIVDQINIKGRYFPVRISPSRNDEIPSDRASHNLYELYSQLYLVMKRQGDRFNELRYYATALEWHRKSLKGTSQRDTAWLLCLNKISTNYGQSWIKGALVTLVVGAFFYFLYVISFSEISVSLIHPDCELTWYLFGHYFQFLNPAHRYDFIISSDLISLKPNPLSKMIDFFGRISVGFMIYQTIAASRRIGHR